MAPLFPCKSTLLSAYLCLCSVRFLASAVLQSFMPGRISSFPVQRKSVLVLCISLLFLCKSLLFNFITELINSSHSFAQADRYYSEASLFIAFPRQFIVIQYLSTPKPVLSTHRLHASTPSPASTLRRGSAPRISSPSHAIAFPIASLPFLSSSHRVDAIPLLL